MPTQCFTGGCLCGAVRYRAEGPASNATLCHCKSCRRAAAAPLVAWVTFPRATLSYTSGQPASYRSSEHVSRTFCRACGTPLTYQRTDAGDEIDLTLCSLDDPNALPPADHTWIRHKLTWLHFDDGLPTFPTTREDGPPPEQR